MRTIISLNPNKRCAGAKTLKAAELLKKQNPAAHVIYCREPANTPRATCTRH